MTSGTYEYFTAAPLYRRAPSIALTAASSALLWKAPAARSCGSAKADEPLEDAQMISNSRRSATGFGRGLPYPEVVSHPSSSHEQTEAEALILKVVRDRLGTPVAPARVDLPGGSDDRIDGLGKAVVCGLESVGLSSGLRHRVSPSLGGFRSHTSAGYATGSGVGSAFGRSPTGLRPLRQER